MKLKSNWKLNLIQIQFILQNNIFSDLTFKIINLETKSYKRNQLEKLMYKK